MSGRACRIGPRGNAPFVSCRSASTTPDRVEDKYRDHEIEYASCSDRFIRNEAADRVRQNMAVLADLADSADSAERVLNLDLRDHVERGECSASRRDGRTNQISEQHSAAWEVFRREVGS